MNILSNCTDDVQRHIYDILSSHVTFEFKMQQLDELEPIITDLYARGLTTVKPVHLMTADDLVS